MPEAKWVPDEARAAERAKTWTVRKVKVADFDQDVEDALYCLSRPVAERFEVMEEMRRQYYGEDDETHKRLPRSAWPIRKVRR